MMKYQTQRITDDQTREAVERIDENFRELRSLWKAGDMVMSVSRMNRKIARPGWLRCDGQTYSSIQYPELAKAIGDGSSTFEVPDMEDKIPVGVALNGVVNAAGTDVSKAAGYDTLQVLWFIKT
jgi:hypothetical protein